MTCRAWSRGSAVVGALLPALLAGCSTERLVPPARTATEQLLISTAVDRAVERLADALPADGAVYVDPGNLEGFDGKYALGAMRDGLLRRGARLAFSREKADTVVEMRAGALSVDDRDALIGVPSFGVPIPLSGDVNLPEIAIFKKDMAQGVAKLAATAYDAHNGALVKSAGPEHGFAHKIQWTLLVVVTWDSSDLMARGTRPDPAPWE